MENTVLFRDFEERDIDFIYKCKSDENLNKMVVGKYRPFTYEESAEWVHNCMKHDRPDLRFWAICTNDEKKRIVGWCALANIDSVNQSCSTHSIVINDSDYNDGIAWLETVLFLLHYSFEVLLLNRVWGVCIKGHPMSGKIGKLIYMTQEGIERQAILKDGHFLDLQRDAILKYEYFNHKNNGDYEIMKIIRRLRTILKEEREQQ